MSVLAPELTWYRGSFRPSLQVEILDDGTVGRVAPGISPEPERLPGEALLPGFVNAHSHAFQRGLRGKGERSGSFWSWREEMYRLAETVDPDRFRHLSALAFREMLASGITTVGEFHYLHHLPGSHGFEMDEAVLEAAREAGIRLVLLDACYMTASPGKPLAGPQRRFQSKTVDEFLRSAESVASLMDPRLHTLGLVAHSIRAVPLEAIVSIHETARRRNLVFHVHVEEQEKEIEVSLAHYGKRPLELLLEHLTIGAETTAVHCTHSRDEDLERFLAAGGNVCLCPLTEANLADGTAPHRLSGSIERLSLGTDSNLRVDFTEEMRLLEYGQRLREERRAIFTAADGLGPALFRIATEGGARSLGIRAGRIETGYAADFVTIDLGDPALEGAAPEELLTAFVLGAGLAPVRRVGVAGRWMLIEARFRELRASSEGTFRGRPRRSSRPGRSAPGSRS